MVCINSLCLVFKEMRWRCEPELLLCACVGVCHSFGAQDGWQGQVVGHWSTNERVTGPSLVPRQRLISARLESPTSPQVYEIAGDYSPQVGLV